MTVTISPLDVEWETRPCFLSFLVFLSIIANKISSITDNTSQPTADIGIELDVQDMASASSKTRSVLEMVGSSHFPKHIDNVAKSMETIR